MGEAGVPGVSITVIKDFRIHWTLTAGVADQDSGRAVTPATLFQAASLSKPVKAVPTAVLAEQGKLDLDEDIGRYLRTWQLPPMSQSRYSGGGSLVMQLLMMDLTQGSFPELMRLSLLKPLGMMRSNFQQPLSPRRGSGAPRVISRFW